MAETPKPASGNQVFKNAGEAIKAAKANPPKANPWECGLPKCKKPVHNVGLCKEHAPKDH